MEVPKKNGVLMRGDVVPVVEEKAEEPEKGSGKSDSLMPIYLFVAAYAALLIGVFSGEAIVKRNYRIAALSRASFGEVVNQSSMTVEDAANGDMATFRPERWYDEYCVVGGSWGRSGDYAYVKLAPEAYEALKPLSEFERKWGPLSLYGRANCVLRERREKAHEASASPEVK